MKKRPILAFASLFLLSLLLASSYLIERRPLQDHLLDYLEQSLKCKASVGAVTWRWLPVPTITISQLRAETKSFALVLPKTRLILNPKFLITGEMSLAYAKLFEPNLTIKATPPPGWIGLNPSLAGTFTTGHFSIVDGSLSLPGQSLGHDLLLQAVTMTGINGAVRSRSNSLKFDLRARSSFARALTIKGGIDLPPEKYRINLVCEDLDSSQLLNQSPHDSAQTTPETPEVCAVASPLERVPSLPVVTGLNLSAHFEGLAGDHFQLQVGSKKKPFTLSWHGHNFQIEKVDGLTLDRQNDDFSIDIKELSVAEPKFLLNGHIARKVTDNNVSQVPEWSVDLKGAGIDLGAVRRAILNIFKENTIAKKVCVIVRGGQATTASYSFQGGLADFKELKSMKIWADAKDVPITLPGLGLVIDQASGPISIINGQLTGRNLTATIDKSHGTNGDLLLDLEKDQHAFQLELDLAADLQNLHDVLSRIIPSPLFQNELSRFSDIKGQAHGHLRLGDDLRHVKTEVDVHKVEASGFYDRLPWPFTISGGRLLLAPQQLDWEDVRGTLGKQQISSTTGMVTWQDAIHATIKALDADLDLKSLFEEGTLTTNNATLAIRDFSHGRFNDISGQAQLKDSFFTGPIRAPEQWQYQTSIKCSDFKVAGEDVPELHSQGLLVDFSNQQADFSGLFTMLDQEVFLSGHYRHNFFDKWQGDLEINGDIGERLGAWLKEKHLTPDAIFPKLPFRLEKFFVTNPGPGFDFILAHGTIIPLPQTTETKLQVSISRLQGQTNNTFTFLNGDRQGSLNYQVWPDQGNRNLLAWQGELSAETLDALFSQQFLESGQVHGTFSRLTDQSSSTYSGAIEANRVRFSPESLTPDLTIDTLRLLGNDNTITIDVADLALADVPANIAGRVTEAEGLHSLDLQVKAPQLSWKSLQKVFEVYSKRASADDQEKSAIDSLRGTVNFDIDAFDNTHQTKNKDATEGETENHTFTSNPFTGTINLKPTGIEMLISKSKVCGISGQGAWYFGDETKDDVLSFSSGDTPLSFEEALPCLGFKQSLIIGPLSIEGQISGRPKQWRQGTLTLSSPEGLIKRMTLLSKIFTAVNVTDYFTWQDLPDMKEEGLSYNDLTLKAHIDSNNLVLDRTIIKGKGVNLSGRGTINLTDLDSDLTFFIAPFKSLDWLVTNLPLIGKSLGGAKESILTFPVSVTGNIKSPEVTALAPEAIGSAVLELFGDTLTLPFRIFQPEQEQDEGLRAED